MGNESVQSCPEVQVTSFVFDRYRTYVGHLAGVRSHYHRGYLNSGRVTGGYRWHLLVWIFRPESWEATIDVKAALKDIGIRLVYYVNKE